MAVRTVSAFAAGVIVGWVGRSTVGSTRDAMVQGVVLGHRVREGIKRVVAEQVEWVEDMFAEGRARFDQQQAATPPVEEYGAPHVVQIKKKRGHAA